MQTDAEVTGNRAGVTDVLVNIAALHFFNGRKVLFVSSHMDHARSAFDRFVEVVDPTLVTSARRASLDVKGPDAAAWFISGRPGTAGRGCDVDTLILDDADFYSDKSLASLIPTTRASSRPFIAKGRVTW